MSTPPMHDHNADQIAFWNGHGGHLWTERQEAQDAVLAPISAILLDRAAAATGERVADIGCGCGATTLALAERVGPSGHVVGVDVSAEMLSRARARTGRNLPIEYVQADATIHPFEPERTDLLFSRFGVMFFADPAQSFANMRTALHPEGRLVFACWREPRANPWAMTPLQAAYQHLPRLPAAGPEDPGLFSFAQEERVRRILAAAGFGSIAMQPHDLEFDLAMGQGLEAAASRSLEFGPVSRATKDQPPELVAAAKAAIEVALAPFAKGTTVPLAAALWIVSARRA